MANSADVAALDDILASQYNNLRADVLDTSSGHLHDAINGRLHATFAIGTLGPSTSRGLLIDGTATSAGTTQYGAEVSPTLTSAATTAGAALYGALVTAAAAFTMVTGSGLLIDVPTIGAASAVTTQRGIFVANQGVSGVTNAYGVFVGAQSGAATVNVGIFNAGTTRLDNVLTFGSTINTAAAIHITTAIALSGATTQYGVQEQATFGSGATANGIGQSAQVVTAAASFTMTTATGFYAFDPSKGGGSTITTSRGVYVAAQTAGATNNYGVYVEAPSGGATTNIGIFNAGTTQLSGVVGAGIAPSTDRALYIFANSLTGTFQYGIACLPSFASAATSGGTAGYFRGATVAASFTAASIAAVQVADASKGAGSTITTAYGFLVDAQTQGGTNNYGVYVNAPSGGSGQNVAIATATGGTVKIGGAANRSVTQPTNSIDLYNGTAPAGTLTNGVTLYSAAGELTVMDAAGTATTLSPHDDDGNWVFHSWDTVKRTRLLIDVEKLLRHANRVWGLDFVHELPYRAA